MRYRVFRQGSRKEPMINPMTDEPWVFAGQCDAKSWSEAVQMCCGNEPPIYGSVWYIALAQDGYHGENPEYWKDENGVHGQPYKRPW